MNLQEFLELNKEKKNADQVNVVCANGDKCMHSDQPNIKIGKGAAIKNFRKHNDEKFICRKCDMYYDNPMTKVGKGIRSKDKLDELIEVTCPICLEVRKMKLSSYTGSLDQKPYLQVDGSCVQKGKVISEEQKEAIREALSGIERSEEFKQKLSDYMKNNPEGIERGKKNLIAGYSSGWNTGLTTPQEVRDKQSEALKGKKKTLEHRYHISLGRKKMLDETGGFTREHRENLSKATIVQYKNGFDPNLYHRRGWHFSEKLNKKLFYKSSYEKKVYMLLDEDESVLNYEYEDLVIEYYNPIKKINSNYIIDLKINYVDGKTSYVEVKPAKHLMEDNNNKLALEAKAKIEAAYEQLEKIGLIFDVWTEVHLFGPINTEKKIRDFIIWLDQQPEQNEGK
jgi:hypothetical protein